jgi:hypothetical protein
MILSIYDVLVSGCGDAGHAMLRGVDEALILFYHLFLKDLRKIFRIDRKLFRKQYVFRNSSGQLIRLCGTSATFSLFLDED